MYLGGRHEIKCNFLSLIKCIGGFEVTFNKQIAHLFIMGWIQFYFCSFSQRTLAELKSSQHPEKDLNLSPKSWKIPMKTDENGT